MLVLIVTNFYPTPSRPYLGTFVFDQVESLRAQGIDADVLHIRREAHGKSVYRNVGATVSEKARSVSPDVVHVMYGGVMAEIVTRVNVGAPVVVSFCGSDLLGGRLGGAGTRFREHAGKVASRRAARRARGIIVKSEELRAALPAGLDPGRIWTIPNGVDLDRFAPVDRLAARSALGWPPDEATILFPASPVRREKRYDLAQAAVSALQRLRPAARLRALDGVPHSDVPTWLNASDAVIVTSSHEGSPNVVKEALACSTPVVAVDVGDIRERISDITGCAVVPREPEALAVALQAALDAPRTDEGRRRVAELALPRVAERIADVYASVSQRP